MKVKLKIGRNVFFINEYDIVLDNGSCSMLISQTMRKGFYDEKPTISKTQINELKKKGILYTNEKLKKLAYDNYQSNIYIFYRFNINLMIENGYEVVEDLIKK